MPHYRPTHGTVRMRHRTQSFEIKIQSKATSSLFPSEMIANLETALSTVHQNNDHTIKLNFMDNL